MRIKTNFLKVVCLAAALSSGASVFGQLGIAGVHLIFIGKYIKYQDAESKAEITYEVGQKIFTKDGTYVGTITEDGYLALVPGKSYVSISKDGTAHKFEAPNKTITSNFSIYPLTAFSTAGVLIKPGQTQAGGTLTTWGTVLAFDVKSPFSKSTGAWEAGGFFMFPNQDSLGNLYEIYVRHFWKPWLGLQLGYLDSTNTNQAASLTGYAVFRIDSTDLIECKTPWAAEFGVGALGNYSNDQSQNAAGYISNPRKSYDFSSFIQFSVGLSGNLSLVGTEWYIRNRNDDSQRVSLGLAYKFR